MAKYIIEKELSDRILFIADEYRNNAVGGIAAVLQYYRPYFETFPYIASYKSSSLKDKFTYVFMAYIRLIYAMLFNRKIELLHIHTAADGSFWTNRRFIQIAKFFNKKVILHIHASRFKDFYNEANVQDKAKIVKLLNRVDSLIVLSKSWKSFFEEITSSSTNIEVLNNITQRVELDAKCRDKVKNYDKLHCLFLGEIGHRKGVFDLLNMLYEHREEFRDKLCLHIGGNKNEDLLLQEINSKGLGDFVYFDGFVVNDKKKALLSEAQVFVLPSYNEGLPISILEAMSYACAIVSTYVGGIPELIENSHNGILINAGDIEALYRAVKTLMYNKELLTTMSQNSLQAISSYYPETVLGKLHNIYKAVLY